MSAKRAPTTMILCGAIAKEVRDRPQLKRALFRHYIRVVFLNTEPDQALRTAAQAIADELELPLETRSVGYGQLESRLSALVNGTPWP